MNSTIDIQAIATNQLISQLEQQSNRIAPESFQAIRMALRGIAVQALEEVERRNRIAIESVLSIGQQFLEIKQGLKRLEYKIFLGEVGWSMVKANKYAKLTKTFVGFSLEQIGQLELATLFLLCLPKYGELVEKLRSIPALTQLVVERMMKEVRPQSKPKQVKEGWQRDESGGGRHYAVNLYHEEAAIAVEKQAASEGVLPTKIIAEAVLMRQQVVENKLVQQKQQAEEKFWLEIETAKLQQCDSWSEIESTVKCDRTHFNKIVRNWSESEKQQLISKLVAHLNKKPDHLRSLVWVPARLLIEALFASSLKSKLFPTTPKYDPYARSAAGARSNWKAVLAIQHQNSSGAVS